MKDSEKNATGCATWYYRYSVALMYCGRLEEALEYAERGALEEPDYPWIWLHLGKLRAHFGDKSGALDAVKQGLKLEPGDYEFLTLKKEIKAGATLEQMEYHWINPDADQTLQRGLDENADDKQCAIACIRVAIIFHSMQQIQVNGSLLKIRMSHLLTKSHLKRHRKE